MARQQRVKERTSESSAPVEQRVARQETAEEARGLIAEYVRAIDAQDPDALPPLLAPHIVVTSGQLTVRDVNEVVNFFGAYWSDQPATRRHFITNVAFATLSPTSAVATSYFLFTSAVESASMIGWGTYRDTFARGEDGALRFTAKDITVELDVAIRSGWAAELGRSIGTRR